MTTQERLKELFYYQRGQLIRRVLAGSRGVAGEIAGTLNSNGYIYITVDNNRYFAHRLIWLYHYGYLPKYLDHKYGKEIGNYVWNLRPCTASQNRYNSKTPTTNNSGVKGISWDKSRLLWLARIKINGKGKFLGRFNSKKEAAKVVSASRVAYHGEFANNG